MGLNVVILTRNAWGLGQDGKLIEQALRETNISGTRIDTIDYLDSITFYGNPQKQPQVVDIQIHLEMPCHAAMKWAKVNVLLVNPEWWLKDSMDWTFQPVDRGGMDLFLFRSVHARALFPHIDGARTRILPWRTVSQTSTVQPSVAKKECLYLIGASENKLGAAHVILDAWKASYPRLHIVGTSTVIKQLRERCSDSAADWDARGITVRTSYTTDAERVAAQASYAYHVCASEAEGFGYTFAEAIAVGAIPLWNTLPVYSELYGSLFGSVGRIESTAHNKNQIHMDTKHMFTTDAVARGIESITSLTDDEYSVLRTRMAQFNTSRIKEYRQAWRNLMGALAQRVKTLPRPAYPPKPINPNNLPHVGVITLAHNRPRWFANMAQNILTCGYPFEKLTWVIADDGDYTGGRVDGAVDRFKEKHPSIDVIYISMTAPITIGEKRNAACAAATGAATAADVFIMMDDDDHYPAGSIARRISWLKGTGKECVYCATIPMYDTSRYISAMNVPPLHLPIAQRISEATLCFTRKFWLDRKFSAVSMAEGEGFVVGREHETEEISPVGIIVSFIHGKNSSSRRTPEMQEPNGCHYGFSDDYFKYISELGLSEA